MGMDVTINKKQESSHTNEEYGSQGVNNQLLTKIYRIGGEETAQEHHNPAGGGPVLEIWRQVIIHRRKGRRGTYNSVRAPGYSLL